MGHFGTIRFLKAVTRFVTSKVYQSLILILIVMLSEYEN